MLPMLILSVDAKAAWVSFHDRVESELVSGGTLYDVQDVASKIADNAARIAALFHLLIGGGGAIGADTINAACAIAEWHLNEARRFFGELAFPVELVDAARLDSWLISYCHREGCPSVPVSAIQKSGPGGLREKAKMESALSVLGELDRARVIRGPGKAKTVLLNPALLAIAVAVPAVFAVIPLNGERKTAITAITEAANPPAGLAAGQDWDRSSTAEV